MRTAKHILPPGMKRCPSRFHIGERVLPIEQFNGGYCIDCYRTYHREQMRKTRQEALERLRREAIQQYGKRCSICGEGDPLVLSLLPSHEHGERSQLQQLQDLGWPKQDSEGRWYRMICQNCLTRLRVQED